MGDRGVLLGFNLVLGQKNNGFHGFELCRDWGECLIMIDDCVALPGGFAL